MLNDWNREHFAITCLVRDPSRLPEELRSKVSVIEGDLQDESALQRFVNGLDVCVHLASHVGYGTVEQYRKTNIEGTENLCKAIRDHNFTCRLIQCSSIAVLRRHKLFSFLNTDYANSKSVADQCVAYYQRWAGLNTCFIYPGLIYGPEDTHLVPTLTKYLRRGILFYISGGEQHCPAVYIDDLCALFIHAIETDLRNGEQLIGVGPQEFGIHQFIAELADAVGVTAPSVTLPKWLLTPVAIGSEFIYKLLRIRRFPTISRRTVDFLSINLPPQLVGHYNGKHWQARTNARDGIREAVRWCREKQLI